MNKFGDVWVAKYLKHLKIYQSFVDFHNLESTCLKAYATINYYTYILKQHQHHLNAPRRLEKLFFQKKSIERLDSQTNL